MPTVRLLVRAAEAVREAKLAPLRRRNIERLRRVVGDVPDLGTRAEVGPALILPGLLPRGRPPSAREIRERVVPLMLGGHERGAASDHR
ncbi:hypothetical protein ACWEQU_30730 [Streptomyces nodosus]